MSTDRTGVSWSAVCSEQANDELRLRIIKIIIASANALTDKLDGEEPVLRAFLLPRATVGERSPDVNSEAIPMPHRCRTCASPSGMSPIAGCDYGKIDLAPGRETMVLLNQQTREIQCKIVYYGTGLGGKTTNLQYIHKQVAPSSRGELVSLATASERTLFFDFLPLDLGQIQGWKIRFALYTVPGQVEYNASRRMVLTGADAVVFVADSDINRSAENKESLKNMFDNLAELSFDMENFPFILQYNKRDLKTAMPLERLEEELNARGVPSYQAIALEGLGVFASLRGISQLLLAHLEKVL
jgi:small GTP-binding protein